MREKNPDVFHADDVYLSHIDMTSAVDWALKANYLYLYLLKGRYASDSQSN